MPTILIATAVPLRFFTEIFLSVIQIQAIPNENESFYLILQSI